MGRESHVLHFLSCVVNKADSCSSTQPCQSGQSSRVLQTELDHTGWNQSHPAGCHSCRDPLTITSGCWNYVLHACRWIVYNDAITRTLHLNNTCSHCSRSLSLHYHLGVLIQVCIFYACGCVASSNKHHFLCWPLIETKHRGQFLWRCDEANVSGEPHCLSITLDKEVCGSDKRLASNWARKSQLHWQWSLSVLLPASHCTMKQIPETGHAGGGAFKRHF